jgi:hypothetical protein
MAGDLTHRGPDALLVLPPIVLGDRRLSFLDLSPTGQPMGSEDGDIFLTYNSEVYNYREGAGEAVMGVDKVEAAMTEGTPQLEARLGVGLLALTVVKGEHLDVYAKRMHVLDQVAHEAARRRVGLRSGTCW